MLSSDPSDEVRNAIAATLKQYGKGIAPKLVSLLEKEEEWQVRLRIVKVLSEPDVSKGILNDDQFKLYEIYEKEENKIVGNHLAKLLNRLAL
jgi:hypothetical protein